ncbi:MAG TPA: FAD-dependent oxidoreductase [Planctomycetaceae bacterium]|nr:FAD-dependent oxidoreductase [Planctomycetaceae bacterium]
MTASVDRHVDVLIVGHGLAGTALAWELLWREVSCLIIDREDAETSSRVAAGLVTPVTGRRFVRSGEWDRDRQNAEQFYTRVGETLGQTVFHPQEMLRLFATAEERNLFEQKFHANDSRIQILPESEFDRSALTAPFGGFAMLDAARLDVAKYLDLSRDYFRSLGRYRTATFDDSKIDPSKPMILEDLDISAERAIFCQGFAAVNNRWFAEIPFDATQGEILTIRLPGWTDSRVIHRGIWIAPERDELYRIGATHQRSPLDGIPTQQGRAELLDRLHELLPRADDVVEQRAAVRPILQGRQPAIGFHPKYPRLGYFNGLGSKGSLLAPGLAAHLAGVLAREDELAAEYDFNRRWNLST